MTSERRPGELFARQYIERGAPVQDSVFFRNRLAAFLQEAHYSDFREISGYIKKEAGFMVPTFYSEQSRSLYYKFDEYFSQIKVEYFLSSITLVWRFLRLKYRETLSTRNPANPIAYRYPKAEEWRAFVERALREENLAYSVDAECGVHFFVDEEFERNRLTALAVLALPRYSAVKTAFEAAHRYLDSTPADTKAAVRSAFEALEILARLMDPPSKNLNRWMVENKLKPLVVSAISDQTEATVAGKLLDGLAQAVDGLHNIRHGQGIEAPVVPSLEVSVYVLSVVAASIRWLASTDQVILKLGSA